jgi:methionine-S-sulfoxide reductase
MVIKEIYLAGGCFWGTQHYLRQVRGIVDTAVGYANGNIVAPTYEQVYTDTTGFAEVVKVVFDATSLSLDKLVEVYFNSIDPTSINQQGEDVGTRYRTGIYYVAQEDEPVIMEVFNRIATQYERPLVVEVTPLRNFYVAEEFHQDYLEKHPDGYCHIPMALMEFAKQFNQ